MSNEIVRIKGGYDFTKAHVEARKHLAYYEEGLVLDVAARVIDTMEARRITRSDLARRLAVSPAYITKVLRGQANLSLESLAKLAFALDLKWECVLIPINAQIGVLALAYESGAAAIRTVETATVEGISGEPAADQNAEYSEGTRYELPLSA